MIESGMWVLQTTYFDKKTKKKHRKSTSDVLRRG